MALTDVLVRSLKSRDAPYKITDSGGLFLMVAPSGAKLWRYRFRINGRENVAALGAYPDVGLSDARSARDDARRLVRKGINPTHHKRAEAARTAADAANTFVAVASEWIETKKAKWSPSYLRQVETFLKLDVYPVLGARPVRSLAASDFLAVLRTIGARKAPTVAILVRQWCSAVMRYAIITQRADNDPAAALRGAIERPRVKHHRALTIDELPIFFAAVEGGGINATTKIALELLTLTFVRPGELRRAQWSEFNLDRAVWTIPAERMKMRVPHVVPLSRQALALLGDLRKITGWSPLLFPNRRRPRESMSVTTLNRALERMGLNGRGSVGFSAHGFRATASTMLHGMGFQSEWIERQLAHNDRNSVRASYNFAQFLPERRSMMQRWADVLAGLRNPAEKVVAGRFGADAAAEAVAA